MKVEQVAKWSAFVLIVVLALVIQSVAFDRRLERQRAELMKDLRSELDQRMSKMESRLSQLEGKSRQPVADAPVPPPTPVVEQVVQSVQSIEKRLGKLEQTPAAATQARVQESPVPMFTSDLKATPQFKEAIRPTVKEIMKEEEEKSWQARREGMSVRLEDAVRKELTTLGVGGQTQDQLVKMYKEEAGQWGSIWWGEYQSKLRDGSFKDLTPEQRQQKKAETDEKLKQLEASYDEKKRTLLTPPQLDKMKEFEKKYWNRN